MAGRRKIYSSGSHHSSGRSRPQSGKPAHDFGVKLGECSRGRGQELRFRWKVLERDDGTFRAFLELRGWTRSPDGWVPSRIYVRIRPSELNDLADAVERAIELASEFDFDHGPGAA